MFFITVSGFTGAYGWVWKVSPPTSKKLIKPETKIDLVILGCSTSRGMRQTFSSLSKLGGTTSFNGYVFSLVTLSKYYLLMVWRIFVNLTILAIFFLITRPKIVAANFRKMEKMRLDEI